MGISWKKAERPQDGGFPNIWLLYHHPFIVPHFRTRYNPILLLRASIEAILVQVRQDAAEGRQFFQLFVDPCGRRGPILAPLFWGEQVEQVTVFISKMVV